MKKYKKRLNPIFYASIDRCPSCRGHFRFKQIKTIYRDVVECLSCGYIWVLLDEPEFKKYADDKKTG